MHRDLKYYNFLLLMKCLQLLKVVKFNKAADQIYNLK